MNACSPLQTFILQYIGLIKTDTGIKKSYLENSFGKEKKIVLKVKIFRYCLAQNKRILSSRDFLSPKLVHSFNLSKELYCKYRLMR